MTDRPTIVPVLVYADIEAAHDELVSVFGFASGGLHRADDGTVVHGEVTIGGSTVWLHAVAPDHRMASPRDADASHVGMSVLVADVDAHHAAAVAAGARIESSPVDQDYGLREYGARDREGHRWWFCAPSTSEG